MNSTLAILAAGLGTRFGGGGAKQLEPLGPSGETLIDYSIHDALRAGFDRVVLIVRPEQEPEFKSTVVTRWNNRTKVTLEHQQPRDAPVKKAWGTAHATLCIANAVDGPFAIINGDDFYGREAIAIAAVFCNAALRSAGDGAFTPDYAVVGFPVANTLRTGSAVSRAILHSDAEDRLVSIEEARIVPGPDGIVAQSIGDSNTHGITPDTPVSMNMWGFTPAVFPQLERAFRVFAEQHRENSEAEFLLPHFVGKLVEEGSARVRVLRGTGSPTGITHPDDRESVREYLRDAVQRGDYRSPLWGSNSS